MISRRDFLKTAGASAAALAVNPLSTLEASAKNRKEAPKASEKINVAFVGIGYRGGEDARHVLDTGMVNVVALCDVNMGAPHTQQIIGLCPGVPQYKDFRNQIDRSLNVTDKMRYAFINNGSFFKLDVFDFDTSKGILCVDHPSDGRTVEIPDYIIVLKDVTGDVNYKNYFLAKSQKY